jgi:putative ABC transport system ATP-binding protein
MLKVATRTEGTGKEGVAGPASSGPRPLPPGTRRGHAPQASKPAVTASATIHAATGTVDGDTQLINLALHNRMNDEVYNTRMTEHVVLKDVEKHYREGDARRQVLSRVGARIERGTILAVQGRSGSGKTTLLNLIGGLDTPDAGSVRVDGRDIHAMDDRNRTLFRRRHCGFVFQFFNLVPTLTARENIMIGLELNGIGRKEASRRAVELLEALDLPDRADSFPDQLSGGEQQRVALARALAPEPGLLLADEPTGNLDADTEVEILDLIARLPSRRQTTVIIATHSDLVAGYADRVMAITAGVLADT